MSCRSFITGIGGFAGSHLAEALLEAGDVVEGTCLPSGTLANIRHIQDRIGLHSCDIRSPSETADTVRRSRPDVVYHLAAAAYVPEAESDPRGIFETNFLGTLNLLEALRREAPGALLVFISSSEVYGRVLLQDNPVREDHTREPVHMYGLSKLVSELLVETYAKTRGLAAIRLRPFNHTGPRQSDQFVCSSFARQAARIDLKLQEPVMRVGNLSLVRDFTDVRDVARAYRLAAGRCEPGSLYQIASGTGVSIASVLEKILSFTRVSVEVREDPSRMRAVNVPVIVGDSTRFAQATGWRPSIAFADSLRDLYLYWRKQIAEKGVS